MITITIAITIQRKGDLIAVRWRGRTAEGATVQEALVNMGAEIDVLRHEFREFIKEHPFEDTECMDT